MATRIRDIVSTVFSADCERLKAVCTKGDKGVPLRTPLSAQLIKTFEAFRICETMSGPYYHAAPSTISFGRPVNSTGHHYVYFSHHWLS